MIAAITAVTTMVSVSVGSRPKISNIIICTKSTLPIRSSHRSLSRISILWAVGWQIAVVGAERFRSVRVVAGAPPYDMD